MIAALIPAITSLFGKVIDGVVEDRALAETVKARAFTRIADLADAELKGAVEIVVAEARGESWVQRSWRPLTMLAFVAVILWQWVGPLFTDQVPTVPNDLYELIKIGLGGYVVGRSAEKVASAWKGGGPS